MNLHIEYQPRKDVSRVAPDKEAVLPQIVGASSIQTGQGRRLTPSLKLVDPANRKRGRRPREETSSRQNESFSPAFHSLIGSRINPDGVAGQTGRGQSESQQAGHPLSKMW